MRNIRLSHGSHSKEIMPGFIQWFNSIRYCNR